MVKQAMTRPILSLQKISKRFAKELDLAEQIAKKMGAQVQEEVVHAVSEVSFHVNRGEVVGLVGESGCGKSTLGRIVAGLLQPSEGSIQFDGKDLQQLSGVEARKAALSVQMIFQDPMSSLNSRKRVLDIVGEAPVVHGLIPRNQIVDYVVNLLGKVGLDPETRNRYPHQFSGGQRQRIGIARALAVQPKFLVCDESVAALDVSIQAQVLNLFMDLREEFNLTYLFISHDLGVVEHLSDRVLIMYLGRVVEQVPTGQLFSKGPNHPYASALLEEVPRLNNRRRSFRPITGEIPSPLNPPTGCHFHPRCPHASERCGNETPLLKEIASQHFSACHLNDC
jgi:oligopeptide/dipeptide ABC transporter ATP-binding protein